MLDILSGKDRSLYATCLRAGLSCLTPVYRLGVAWRNLRYDRAQRRTGQTLIRRVPIPVISIGNLTTGGTGKTPHVISIAKSLRKEGRRVALISRGYGVDLEKSSRNDEAMEMEHRLPDVPHLQDPNRAAMAEIAVTELESEVILLDDGFQHRWLHRDLDIVIVDATNPFGYDRLLPRGLLREPIGSLKRADWVILSRTDQVSQDQLQAIMKRMEGLVGADRILHSAMVAKEAINVSGKLDSLESIKHHPTFAFCGIGNPGNFFSMLQQLEVPVIDTMVFPDHHPFGREDLKSIGRAAKECEAEQILCTHKDLVKMGVDQVASIPLRAILIDVEFLSPLQPLLESIRQQFSELPEIS